MRHVGGVLQNTMHWLLLGQTAKQSQLSTRSRSLEVVRLEDASLRSVSLVAWDEGKSNNQINSQNDWVHV